MPSLILAGLFFFFFLFSKRVRGWTDCSKWLIVSRGPSLFCFKKRVWACDCLVTLRSGRYFPQPHKQITQVERWILTKKRKMFKPRRCHPIVPYISIQFIFILLDFFFWGLMMHNCSRHASSSFTWYYSCRARTKTNLALSRANGKVSARSQWLQSFLCAGSKCRLFLVPSAERGKRWGNGEPRIEVSCQRKPHYNFTNCYSCAFITQGWLKTKTSAVWFLIAMNCDFLSECLRARNSFFCAHRCHHLLEGRKEGRGEGRAKSSRSCLPSK